MARYRFTCEYFGTPFAGWQIQENAITVQGVLEHALHTALRTPIRIMGAGRTDAGVHAVGQVAHFDCENAKVIDCEKLMRSLNALAGPHICVRDLQPCAPEFHARYSAMSRHYRYALATRPVALLRDISWHPHFAVDLKLLAKELKSAEGQYDFLNFSIPRHDGKSTFCHLMHTEIKQEAPFIYIHLQANRYLHKMVRSLVGAAYDVARGAHQPGLISQILKGQFTGERTWAPAQGLCFEKVTYANDVG